MMRHREQMVGGLLWAVLAVWLPTAALAQTFSSGSTGAQGAFPPTGADAPPTGTTQYSLSLTDGKLWYVPGWTSVTLPNVPAGGFRDGVLNFTTFNLPSTVTMYFYKNATNTPVTILTTGNATITGTIELSGANAPGFGRPGTGGPGGYDGGAGGDGLSMTSGGVGLGPGGGGAGTYSGNTGPGGGGGYGSSGGAGSSTYCTNCNGTGGTTYGSSPLRPIVGGSGGGGASGSVGYATGGGGGGGGGAILIASSGTITLSGNPAIRANGGTGYGASWSSGGGGGGSGGAIRVIAPTIAGSGTLSAQPGSANAYGGGVGGNGRIRLEATTLSFTGSTTPLTVTSLPQPVFPSTGQPALVVTSIGGMSVPANPVGSVLAAPDVQLPVGTANPIAVVVTASNVPIGTAVQVTAAPQSGARTTASCALLDGSQASASCTASISIQTTQTNILTASAVFPLAASAGEGRIYAEGEEVKWVRVASFLGGPSTVTYLTATGKQVPATALASRAP